MHKTHFGQKFLSQVDVKKGTAAYHANTVRASKNTIMFSMFSMFSMTYHNNAGQYNVIQPILGIGVFKNATTKQIWQVLHLHKVTINDNR